MSKIIVTIRDEATNQSVDLEIPTNQEMETLKTDIIEAINNDSSMMHFEPDSVDLYSERMNRMFFPTDTCEGAGVWNGDVLLFRNRKY